MSKIKKSSKAVIAAVIIAALAVTAFGVLYNFGFSGLHNNPSSSENQIKVACVGDSITYGHGIKNWSKNNYPSQLAELLGDSYCVANFGVSGSTAQNSGDKPYTEQKMYNESLEFNADVIVIMLGSNDSKPENWNGEKRFKEQYSALIKSYIKNNPNSKIILCSPAKPFYIGGETGGLMKFDINPEHFSEICNVIEETAHDNECVYVDINAYTSDKSQWFSKDGIHPDANGAKEIANYIFETINELDD
ncbi:MAG: GDSL-type esterase/lipase family protein [Eubacterium sp.]